VESQAELPKNLQPRAKGASKIYQGIFLANAANPKADDIESSPWHSDGSQFSMPKDIAFKQPGHFWKGFSI
jgi:hypothetical protein